MITLGQVGSPAKHARQAATTFFSKSVQNAHTNGIEASQIFPYLNVHVVLLMAGSDHEFMITRGWASSPTLVQLVTF